MNWEFRLIQLLPLLAAVVTTGLAVYAWRRRHLAAWIPPFIGLLLAITIWSFGYALEMAVVTLAGKLLLAKVEYLGIATVSLGWFVFAVHYAGYATSLTRVRLGLLSLVPVITILLAFTNESHRLIWQTTTLEPTPYFLALRLTYGWWFWIHVTSSYLLLAAGSILIWGAFRRFPWSYRWQLVVLLISPFIPWLGNVYSLFDLGPIPLLDWTPIAFAAAGLLVAWAIFWLNLFDLVPVARRVTLDSMREGVLVLDMQNRIVDINPAARALVVTAGVELIGQPVAQFFQARPELLAAYENVFEGDSLLSLPVGREMRWYELQISPLLDDFGVRRGRLFVLRDVTRRRQTEYQLEASEQRYRLVSEMMSDYAYGYCVDAAGQAHLEWVTDSFSRVTGYSESDVLAYGLWHTVVHPDDKGMVQARVERLRRGETDVSEYRILTRTGTVRWLRDYGRSVYDEQAGRVTHIYGAATDITESRAAQDDLVAQKQLFESLVTVARATAETPEIDRVLQNAVYVAARLTGAELGSLLLIDEELRVTHSFLSGRENGDGRHDGLLQTVMREGLARWVVNNGRSALIQDTSYDARWVALPDEIKPARSALAVPIASQDQVLGVLTLQHSQVNFFKAEYVVLLEAAADQMALALRNAQMYDQQHRLADHQTILFEVLRTISSHLTPATVVQTATETIARLTKWTTVAILVYDEASNQFVVQSATGSLTTYVDKLLPVKFDSSEQAFRVVQPQVVAGVSGGSQADASEWPQTALSLPLRRGGQQIGVFHIESEQISEFSRSDRQMAEALAEVIALAMDNAKAHAELQDYAAGLSALYTVTRQVSSSLIIGDVLEKTLYAAIQALGFDMGVITLVGSGDDLLRLEAAYGFPEPVVKLMKQGSLRGTTCEYVHVRQEPLQIDDVEQDLEILKTVEPELESVLQGVRRLGARAYSGIPMLHRGESLGSLCLFSRQPRALTLAEVSLQITIGQQIAAALTNAELYTQTTQQLREQTAIREAVAVIGSTIDFADVLDRMAEQMCQVLGATSAYICSFDNESLNSTVLAEYIGETAAVQEQVSDRGSVYHMPTHFTRDLQLLKVGWPTVIHLDDPNLVAHEREHMRRFGAKSLLMLPMQFGGQTIAYAEVWESRRRREFSADEVALAQAIAQQAAIAFENARLFQSVVNERRQLDALIQASGDGIMLVGIDGQIKVINEMLLTLLGLPGSIAVWRERPLHVLVGQLETIVPQAAELVADEVARLEQEAGQPGSGEAVLNGKTLQWLNLPVRSGEHEIGHLMILRNVTHERQLARMREDLVNTIVHDLRNPLSAVNICVELMTEQLGEYALASEVHDYLSIVARNTEKMMRLVDMILDISRLENGQMPISFAPVSLSELVDGVLALQRPLAEEEEIQLEKEVPLSLPLVQIDASLIERVLQNLLDNALKLAPSGRGVIRVEAQSVSTAWGRRVVVSVVDNGPGIPLEIREHMFEKFTTAQGQRRRGTGLGLAFCRMVLDAHEEKIWVAQSSRETGTTVMFSLPIALSRRPQIK